MIQSDKVLVGDAMLQLVEVDVDLILSAILATLMNVKLFHHFPHSASFLALPYLLEGLMIDISNLEARV